MTAVSDHLRGQDLDSREEKKGWRGKGPGIQGLR